MQLPAACAVCYKAYGCKDVYYWRYLGNIVIMFNFISPWEEFVGRDENFECLVALNVKKNSEVS